LGLSRTRKLHRAPATPPAYAGQGRRPRRGVIVRLLARTHKTKIEFAKAIADDTRQSIMQFCCCEGRSVSEIVEHIGVSQPTVSHHLAILRDAGLVTIHPEGRQTIYSLNQQKMAACCSQLMQTFAPESQATLAVQDILIRFGPRRFWPERCGPFFDQKHRQ
jgi:ArsR family transcriptional regulator